MFHAVPAGKFHLAMAGDGPFANLDWTHYADARPSGPRRGMSGRIERNRRTVR